MGEGTAGPEFDDDPAAVLPVRWPRILLVGAALWLVSVLVTFLTSNVDLLPTIILLGSFLAPVTFAAWAVEHAGAERVPLTLIVKAFLIGGVLGTLGASLLEAYLVSPSPLFFVAIALAEEFVKLLALVYVARGLGRRSAREGILLGATVGFGFAALESAGYAMTSVFTVEGLTLHELVEAEILRGVLTPVGHGLWTAILGGVLFAATREGRWTVTRTVGLSGLGVVALHALWNAMSSIAIYVTAVLTDARWQERLLVQGYLPPPTELQLHLYTTVNWLGLLLIASIGLFWLGSMRRQIEIEERHRAQAEQVRSELQDPSERGPQ